MRIGGSVKLRPVRIAFLVRPDDLTIVRRVARLCSCLRGGRYNPIIPFFEDFPVRWGKPFQRLQGIDVARGYVDFFKPDVLVEASNGMAERLGMLATQLRPDPSQRLDAPRQRVLAALDLNGEEIDERASLVGRVRTSVLIEWSILVIPFI